jgi:hypothetical protein
MEEHETPHDAEDLFHDAPYVEVQREEHDSLDDTFDLVDLVEPMRSSDRPRDAHPSKRSPSWLRETL